MAFVNTSGVDTSSDYDKLNRMQVNKLLDMHDIKHPHFCKKSEGIKLLEANKISPRDGIKWERIEVVGEDGRTRYKDVPEVTIPQRPENWDEQKAAQLEAATAHQVVKEKEVEINDLKSQLADLTKLVKEMAEKPKKEPKETDPLNMKYMAQKKWLKEHGVELKKGDNAKELIQKVLDENAT